MPTKMVREFLEKYNVKYKLMMHCQAFTAQDIAASVHIPGREIAKTVILKVDGKIVMAVLPACLKVDCHLLKEVLHANTVELAEEPDFADLFPECELGAMPPLGNLYGIDVIVADKLAEDKTIAFTAGSHREILIMSFADFERLVKPKIVSFTAALVH